MKHVPRQAPPSGELKAAPLDVDLELNRQVREHEIATSWDYQEPAQAFHQFFDRMNAEFFESRLPPCFLSFARSRRNRAGHFHPGYNSVGARFEINLNPLHLDRAPSEQLATLLHEMVHLWQEVYGTPGAGVYHNQQFVAKCRMLGLFVVRGSGYHVGYGDPLVSFLRAHGIDPEPLMRELDDEEGRPVRVLSHASKSKKWTCGCTNARVATVLRALCLSCGQIFRRVG